MLCRGGGNAFVNFHQLFMNGGEVYFRFRFSGGDIAGDVQIIVVFPYFFHGNAAGETFFFPAVLVGFQNFCDVFIQKAILTLAFFKIVRGIDEKDIVRPSAFFQDQDADGNTCGKEQIGGQPDDGVDVAVVQQFFCGCAPPRLPGTARREAE